ncbi:MAG: Rieske 2Fe-2S domain-containing protein [Halioglobus sp.]
MNAVVNEEVKRNSRWPSLHPYPRSWYAVAFADELVAGEVLNRRYFGQELVIYRTESGKAVMINAHCPHMGAHFGHGGAKIVGESIKCPFHGWEFGSTGDCTLMPYGEKQPKRAVTSPWLLREVNGMIMTWYDAEGGEPFFEIPEHDYSGYYGPKQWDVEFKSHPQEVYENGVDIMHFHYIHRVGALEIHECEINDAHFRLTMSSNQDQLVESERFTEGEVPNIHFNDQMYGLGMGYTYAWTVGMDEKFWFSMYVTPIDEEAVHVRQYNMREDCGDDDMNEMLTTAFHEVAGEQITGDIPIWENKIFQKNPSLNEKDRQFADYRRWCKQFYYDDAAELARREGTKLYYANESLAAAQAEAQETDAREGQLTEEEKKERQEMLDLATVSVKKIKEVQGGETKDLDDAVSAVNREVEKS